jgi:2OG-Fe(II) oxygenase superfamily
MALLWTAMTSARIREQLSAQDIIDLCEGRVRAIHLRNYYPPIYAQLLSERLLAHPLFGHYHNAPKLGRVGMAYFETMGQPELRAIYYDKAMDWIRQIRAAAAPYQSPMDLLRLQLQECWAQGANLETVDARPMFVGLARVFEENAGAEPHQDHLLKVSGPDCPSAQSLVTQLAANIYLRLPAAGGELELWSLKPSAAEFRALKAPGRFGADRQLLPEPDTVIRPGIGDAILFDSTHLHSVRPSRNGVRVSLSCYIGYRGPGAPLTYWS